MKVQLVRAQAGYVMLENGKSVWCNSGEVVVDDNTVLLYENNKFHSYNISFITTKNDRCYMPLDLLPVATKHLVHQEKLELRVIDCIVLDIDLVTDDYDFCAIEWCDFTKLVLQVCV